jgi:predicted amidohydrolase
MHGTLYGIAWKSCCRIRGHLVKTPSLPSPGVPGEGIRADSRAGNVTPEFLGTPALGPSCPQCPPRIQWRPDCGPDGEPVTLPDPHSTCSFKLALVQMLVEGGQPEANLRRAARRIDEACRNGAQVVLLPEALDLGWTHSSARSQAQPIPDGASCRLLRDEARRHGIYLCAGIVESAGDRGFNSAVLIDPDGRVLIHHRKLNELDIAGDLYGPGDRLSVVETPFGRLGVMICADAFAFGQVISRTLGMMKAKLILSPCAWAVPADHDQAKEPYGQLWLDNYQPVCRDYRLWIAGASNVGWITDGPWKGRRCIGCSLVIDTNGNVAAQGPYGAEAETILYVTVPVE